MNKKDSWRTSTVQEIEDSGFRLSRSFSASVPVYVLFQSPPFCFEELVRDGLGIWDAITLEHRDIGYILFANPSSDHSLGVTIWAQSNVEVNLLDAFVRSLSTDKDIQFMEST